MSCCSCWFVHEHANMGILEEFNVVAWNQNFQSQVSRHSAFLVYLLICKAYKWVNTPDSQIPKSVPDGRTVFSFSSGVAQDLRAVAFNCMSNLHWYCLCCVLFWIRKKIEPDSLLHSLHAPVNTDKQPDVFSLSYLWECGQISVAIQTC